MERSQVLPSNKSMTFQVAKIIPVQENLRGVHGKTLGKLGELVAGALDDVFAPGVVMVTVTSLRTDHLTVTRVKLTALAQGKAVSLILTQELIIPCLNQGHKGLLGRVD